MFSISAKFVVLLCVATVAGCAAQKKHAAPVSPPETASRLEARLLNDPGLRDYVVNQLGVGVEPWPPASWEPEMLTLAAFYFNPQLATTRARLEEARAAIV